MSLDDLPTSWLLEPMVSQLPHAHRHTYTQVSLEQLVQSQDLTSSCPLVPKVSSATGLDPPAPSSSQLSATYLSTFCPRPVTTPKPRYQTSYPTHQIVQFDAV